MINTYDTIENDYDHTVDVLNKQNYLIYGIVKPLQNLSGSTKENQKHVDNILAYYVKNNPKEIKFVETYYSPYVYRHTTEAKALIETADIFKLYKIGSLELHGDSIFNVY